MMKYICEINNRYTCTKKLLTFIQAVLKIIKIPDLTLFPIIRKSLKPYRRYFILFHLKVPPSASSGL